MLLCDRAIIQLHDIEPEDLNLQNFFQKVSSVTFCDEIPGFWIALASFDGSILITVTNLLVAVTNPLVAATS